MITVIGIYLFILVGFIAKKSFSEIDAKSFVLLSIYFLQPFLTFWGVNLVPLNKNLILMPVIYLVIVFIAIFFTSFFSKTLKDKKEKIIASISPLIGNTGNLGIPLSFALFGAMGASLATIINLANVFFIYSFGIFFFASGEYRFKEAIKKIIKIPVLWVGVLGIIFNLNGIKLNDEVMHILKMGAYASMVIQLIIFGIYLAESSVERVGLRLSFITTFNKFITLPIVGFLVLHLFGIKGIYFKVMMLEILTPLAVTNVNLAALFNIAPSKVAFLTILTSLLFLGIVFIFL